MARNAWNRSTFDLNRLKTHWISYHFFTQQDLKRSANIWLDLNFPKVSSSLVANTVKNMFFSLSNFNTNSFINERRTSSSLRKAPWVCQKMCLFSPKKSMTIASLIHTYLSSSRFNDKNQRSSKIDEWNELYDWNWFSWSRQTIRISHFIIIKQRSEADRYFMQWIYPTTIDLMYRFDTVEWQFNSCWVFKRLTFRKVYFFIKKSPLLMLKINGQYKIVDQIQPTS